MSGTLVSTTEVFLNLVQSMVLKKEPLAWKTIVNELKSSGRSLRRIYDVYHVLNSVGTMNSIEISFCGWWKFLPAPKQKNSAIPARPLLSQLTDVFLFYLRAGYPNYYSFSELCDRVLNHKKWSNSSDLTRRLYDAACVLRGAKVIEVINIGSGSKRKERNTFRLAQVYVEPFEQFLNQAVPFSTVNTFYINPTGLDPSLEWHLSVRNPTAKYDELQSTRSYFIYQHEPVSLVNLPEAYPEALSPAVLDDGGLKSTFEFDFCVSSSAKRLKRSTEFLDFEYFINSSNFNEHDERTYELNNQF